MHSHEKCHFSRGSCFSFTWETGSFPATLHFSYLFSESKSIAKQEAQPCHWSRSNYQGWTLPFTNPDWLWMTDNGLTRSQWDPGGRYKEQDQQVEGGDPPSLPCPGESTSGVLSPILGTTAQGCEKELGPKMMSGLGHLLYKWCLIQHFIFILAKLWSPLLPTVHRDHTESLWMSFGLHCIANTLLHCKRVVAVLHSHSAINLHGAVEFTAACDPSTSTCKPIA